ncbi:glycosyltransferase family 4 protein [Candidatus Woesearchaeota archaeon]|nr:glycosyltransferase family 4 protein [Candidatus Woesearchaeota archaeon]
MKIVHVTGYFQPELGYEEYYLALNQKKLGHDVYVITSDRIANLPDLKDSLKEIKSEYSSRFRPVGFSEINGIKVYRLKTIFEVKDFLIVKGMKKLLREIKPDVVHAHEPRQFITMLPAIYKKDIGYKLICDQHDYDVFPTIKSKFMTYVIRRSICRFAFKKADKIIAITPESRDFVKNVYGVKKEIIDSTLGADTSIFKFNIEKRKELRKRLGIKDKEVLLITAGHIGINKKLELLIEAFSKTKNSKLLIVGGGNGEYIEELKELIIKLNVKDKVIFLGRISQSELPFYYSAADIGVWPSRATITIIEAMACKLTVIIPNINTVKHLVVYDNGLTFQNKEDLLEKINLLIKDKKLREILSKKAEKITKEKFSYENIAKRYIDIYNS